MIMDNSNSYTQCTGKQSISSSFVVVVFVFVVSFHQFSPTPDRSRKIFVYLNLFNATQFILGFADLVRMN